MENNREPTQEPRKMKPDPRQQTPESINHQEPKYRDGVTHCQDGAGLTGLSSSSFTVTRIEVVTLMCTQLLVHDTTTVTTSQHNNSSTAWAGAPSTWHPGRGTPDATNIDTYCVILNKVSERTAQERREKTSTVLLESERGRVRRTCSDANEKCSNLASLVQHLHRSPGTARLRVVRQAPRFKSYREHGIPSQFRFTERSRCSTKFERIQKTVLAWQAQFIGGVVDIPFV